MSNVDHRILVFIPTYNEKHNVQMIYEEVKKLDLNADLVFLDDNSPDGTGQILDKLATTDSCLTVLHRRKKQGVGSAHRAGIKWAYDHSYDTLLTMDSDRTHDPKDALRFLEYANDYELILGSRFQLEDSLSDWNPYRKFLTHLGHFLTRLFLKIPYDATGAFRLYRLDRIPESLFDQVKSDSYAFFFESIFVFLNQGITVKEVPIRLPQRTYGSSKMKILDIGRSLLTLVQIYFRSLKRHDKSISDKSSN